MASEISLDEILKNGSIDTYFQPVVNLEDGSVLGYEALSRGPRGTSLHNPNALITEAKSYNRMGELDRLFKETALTNASKMRLRKPLFVNVDPVALYDLSTSENVLHRCADYGIPPQQIIVEISGKNELCSFETFRKITESYRAAGFSIGYDDINCHMSNIDSMSGVSPDYIKIDGNFVREIDKSSNRQTVSEVGDVLSIARMLGAKVIAVGVETKAELSFLYRLGVQAAQGNLLGKPQKELAAVSEETLELIRSFAPPDKN
jgi:FOG: EAL domain